MLCPTREFLGYAGLIPFITLPLYIGLSSGNLGVLLFSSYSAVIASFIAGSLWGQALHVSAVNRTALFILSNLLSIMPWAGLLLISFGFPLAGLCLLVAVYYGLWWVEKHFLWRVLEFTLLDRLHHYWRLRSRLTAFVVLSHIATIYFLIFKL